MNKYLLYAQMPMVSSRYWNMVHGQPPDQVLEDREGVQIMQVLGKNMAWLLKCIEAGKQEGVSRPKEENVSTPIISGDRVSGKQRLCIRSGEQPRSI